MSVDFTIRKIDNNTVEEAANLVVAVFHESEPLAHLNSADPREFAEYILYLSRKCAAEGLGFIAKDVNSQKVIGAILSSDLTETVNAKAEKNETQNNPIATLIHALNSLYFTNGELEENTYLNIKFVVTDNKFKGKGIVTKLLSTCLKEAKDKGFKYAQAEATGNISQHIFANKLGFDEKAIIKYSEFELNGEKPFSSITEHEGIKLLIKDI